MKNALILIDFDHTLFNTEKFKKAIKRETVLKYRDFLYKDALEFLDYAKKFGKLVLFSEGEVDFQRKKIEKSGVLKFFSKVKIYPTDSKAQNFVEFRGKRTILIDDKPKIADEAIPAGLSVIRVRRGKYKTINTRFTPAIEVKNLKEIIRRDLLSDI